MQTQMEAKIASMNFKYPGLKSDMPPPCVPSILRDANRQSIAVTPPPAISFLQIQQLSPPPGCTSSLLLCTRIRDLTPSYFRNDNNIDDTNSRSSSIDSGVESSRPSNSKDNDDCRSSNGNNVNDCEGKEMTITARMATP